MKSKQIYAANIIKHKITIGGSFFMAKQVGASSHITWVREQREPKDFDLCRDIFAASIFFNSMTNQAS